MNRETPPVIQTGNLSRTFDNLCAVKALNLKIYPGEIFGLVGPDGAGKTTTLRLLSGLLDPSQGEVEVAGYDLAENPALVKDSIGYMAQRFGLYGDLTVEENMTFYADLFGLPRDRRAALMGRLLRMTRMESFRQRQARQLSGGMKQKLGLMCALLHQPRILFLDEPTNGVDPISRRDFWAILYRLVKDGMTVLVTTAYLDEAERCNRVGLMHRGELIRCDTPDAIVSSLVEKCYRVQGSDRRAVRRLLSAQPGVVSVHPSGSVLHLFLSPLETSAAELRTVLARAGLTPIELELIRPSLEDVFIVLVRQRERVAV